MQLLKLAFRNLLKTPFVTFVAVLSLALGIGANGAIFSLFHEMLLKPLPVEEPERLVNLGAPGPKQGSTSCNSQGDCDEIFSYPMFRDLEREQNVLTDLVGTCLFGANLGIDGETRSGEGLYISGAYFRALGLKPSEGRLIEPSDTEVLGEASVAVLSHAYRQSRFGDEEVLGRTLIVNGEPVTIVGVAPEGFHGTTLGSRPDVYAPISMRERLSPGWEGLEDRRVYWVYTFGRLKPDVTLEEAKAALDVQYSSILAEVEAPLQEGMSETTLERFKGKEITVASGTKGQSSLHGEAKTPLLLLFSVTGVVLLIACANVANLLLARSARRGGEMAVRLSIGASRHQLIRQLLGEACLLAALGGLVGILFARWTLHLIGAMLPPEAASTLSLELNLPVIGFAAALALLTGLLFGLFPAFHSTRLDLASVLKGQAGQPSGARSAARFRASLVTAQIALSMALLVCAGLFTKSLVNVSRVDLGVEIDHLVTFGVAPELNGYTPERSRDLFIQAEEELAAIPGVKQVTASLVPILSGNNWGSSVYVQGFEGDADTDRNSRFNEVGPGYFDTLGVPLLAGREFTATDGFEAPKVAIVNETFVKKFGLGRDAVGKWMGRGGSDEELDTEIVGLVRDAKYSEVKAEIPPLFFTPYRQDERLGFINFYVRTAMAPESVMPQISEVVRRLDPNLPVEGLKTMPQQVRENVFIDRMITTLAAAFAVLATLLAAIGLYGVLAYTVTQRTREIGLRMALGADGSKVRQLVFSQLGRMLVVGGVLGIGLAVALGRLASSQLFEMEGHDPAVFLSSIIVLCGVVFLAGLLPAARASRVDPMTALRYE